MRLWARAQNRVKYLIIRRRGSGTSRRSSRRIRFGRRSTISNECVCGGFGCGEYVWRGWVWDLLHVNSRNLLAVTKFHNSLAQHPSYNFNDTMTMNLDYVPHLPQLPSYDRMEIQAPLRQSRRQNNDRFIPNRHATKMGFNSVDAPSVSCPYQKLIADSMLPHAPQHTSRVVNYKPKPPQDHHSLKSILHDLLSKKSSQPLPHTKTRIISPMPQKILDAPELLDDYYLNLMDWASTGQLAIGLNQTVYLYTPTEIHELCRLDGGYVCSINFHPHTPLVSVGNSMGSIGLYDLERRALVRTIAGHQKRVSSLSFSNVLYSGSKDSQILCHDIKLQNSIVGRFTNHKGEVCGLSHSPSGLVSGSNDNTAMIWDLNMGRLRHTLTGHKGAVKALAWCPWQRNLLATGGGSKDKCIKFWNIDTGRCVNTVNAESQVSSLIWNPNEKELLSAHGFSNNQLSLWKFPEMTKISQLHGHSQRILHLALSPDKQTICSASADETLRFWKVFQNESSHCSFSKTSNHLSPCRLR